MKLFTKEIEKRMPPLYSTDGLKGERKVICKFFNPCGSGTWYIVEGERQEDGDWLLFGLVTGLCEDELGYVSLRELAAVRVPPFGLKIERDIYFGEKTLAEVEPKFCERLWGEKEIKNGLVNNQ